jgi:hypothetical protein
MMATNQSITLSLPLTQTLSRAKQIATTAIDGTTPCHAKPGVLFYQDTASCPCHATPHHTIGSSLRIRFPFRRGQSTACAHLLVRSLLIIVDGLSDWM